VGWMRRVLCLGSTCAGLLLVGCSGLPQASISVPLPGAPTNLKLGPRTPFEITLTWRAPAVGIVTGYAVYRNDALVGHAHADTLKFVDLNLVPTSKYVYTVKTNTGSLESSASSPLVGRTTPAPLSDARLDGEYRVIYTVTSSGLFNQHPGQALRYFWSFESRCSSGSCGGKWRVSFSHSSPANGRFQSIPGGFLGTMTNQSFSFCGPKETPGNASHKDSATMRVRTIKAGLRDGEWEVLAFSGTLRVYDAANGFCSATTFQAQLDAQRMNKSG
jgi:hypothetical protein